MDIRSFVNLTSRAWSLPILAQLQAGVPGRQAALVSATGASRTAFAQSMAHLVEMGLVERNPGHGHPLRPEFRMTAQGRVVADVALRLQGMAGGAEQDLLRRSWTLPLLTTLGAPSHFGEIKQRLITISDRALSQSLRVMEAQSWVQRRVDARARPPRPTYCAINSGAVIGGVVRAVIVPPVA